MRAGVCVRVCTNQVQCNRQEEATADGGGAGEGGGGSGGGKGRWMLRLNSYVRDIESVRPEVPLVHPKS